MELMAAMHRLLICEKKLPKLMKLFNEIVFVHQLYLFKYSYPNSSIHREFLQLFKLTIQVFIFILCSSLHFILLGKECIFHYANSFPNPSKSSLTIWTKHFLKLHFLSNLLKMKMKHFLIVPSFSKSFGIQFHQPNNVKYIKEYLL